MKTFAIYFGVLLSPFGFLLAPCTLSYRLLTGRPLLRATGEWLLFYATFGYVLFGLLILGGLVALS